MNNVFATVIVNQESVEFARRDLPGHFTTKYEDSKSNMFFVDSGFWFDNEMDMVINETEWTKQVYFGNHEVVFSNLGLTKIQDEQISK
jgi:hypothetical protein